MRSLESLLGSFRPQFVVSSSSVEPTTFKPKWLLDRIIITVLAIILPHSSWAVATTSVDQVWEKMQSCPALTRSALSESSDPKPISDEDVISILTPLKLAPLGESFSLILQDLVETGFADGKKLKFFVINDHVASVTAEFFESGEIHLKQSTLERIKQMNDFRLIALEPQQVIDLSFVIHEATHAISYALYKLGKFPGYSSHSKVNEALSYYAQGYFLNEMKRFGKFTQEPHKIPIWDQCVRTLSDIYLLLGISPATDTEEAYDKLTDLQFAAMDRSNLPEIPFVLLTSFYESFFVKNKSSWAASSELQTPVPVVTTLTSLIREEIDSEKCELTQSFAYMDERIPLYSRLPDHPAEVSPCDYFKTFSRGLLSILPKRNRTFSDVFYWLRDKGGW